ncbi:MAG: biotin--[acetyl-CoA-carboxylase] ligase [Treponema sp.]|jgi:BirA family biotin operon repressor/biotin-[acetyl-CoA-carboxylase] ligase|nr:biotin--[acetyl-CoA-carboxylase] ligase [Treponema sp.]
MVNGKGVNGESSGGAELSTRAFILSRLRKKPGTYITGESLAAGAGVSRVAVWKGVRSLVEAGYAVTSCPQGYRLEDTEDDFLYPWEFGGEEGRFRHFAVTDSTMNRARECAFGNAPGGTVITAETQTAGRGRNGKKWSSEKGGLFFTMLERPRLSVVNYALLVMAAHIAVCRAVSRVCRTDAFLRWPNDVYSGGKKTAGILSELYGEGDGIKWMAVGAGINVNNRLPVGASGCASLAGRAVSRRDTLLSVLDEFSRIKRAAADPERIRNLWNYHAEGTGRRVVFAGGGKDNNRDILARGIFLGVDYSFRCVIQTGEETAGFLPAQGSLVFY